MPACCRSCTALPLVLGKNTKIAAPTPCAKRACSCATDCHQILQQLRDCKQLRTPQGSWCCCLLLLPRLLDCVCPCGAGAAACEDGQQAPVGLHTQQNTAKQQEKMDLQTERVRCLACKPNLPCMFSSHVGSTVDAYCGYPVPGVASAHAITIMLTRVSDA